MVSSEVIVCVYVCVYTSMCLTNNCHRRSKKRVSWKIERGALQFSTGRQQHDFWQCVCALWWGLFVWEEMHLQHWQSVWCCVYASAHPCVCVCVCVLKFYVPSGQTRWWLLTHPADSAGCLPRTRKSTPSLFLLCKVANVGVSWR